MSGGPPGRWLFAAALSILAAGAAQAADTHWEVSGEIAAFYTDNVYFDKSRNSSSTGTSPNDSPGIYATADIALMSKTPRGALEVDYRPAYNYYTQQTAANNLEHFLHADWKTGLSPKTTFELDELASYTPESTNFQGRGVDAAFTAGPRASQLLSRTKLALEVQASPRWLLTGDYTYRVLNNGSPVTPDSSGAAPVDTILFDEEWHEVRFGANRSISPASSLGGRLIYTEQRFEENLFGPPTTKTRRAGAELTYGYIPTKGLSLTLDAGGYGVREQVMQGGGENVNGSDFILRVRLDRTYLHGTLAVGIEHGFGSFGGLTTTVGTGASQAVVPVGSSNRTTLYGSYAYNLTRRSDLTLAGNATRQKTIDGATTLTTLGAGATYGFRLAEWGGLRVSYDYARQTSDGQALNANEFSRNTVRLGFFFAKPLGMSTRHAA